MESGDGMNSEFHLFGAEAPSPYRVAPSSESQFMGLTRRSETPYQPYQVVHSNTEISFAVPAPRSEYILQSVAPRSEIPFAVPAPRSENILPAVAPRSEYAFPLSVGIDGVQSVFQAASRTDNPPSPALGVAGINAAPGSGGASASTEKKRGRPRKYGPGGTVTMAAMLPPKLSSAPSTGNLTSEKQAQTKGPAPSNGNLSSGQQTQRKGLAPSTGNFNSEKQAQAKRPAPSNGNFSSEQQTQRKDLAPSTANFSSPQQAQKKGQPDVSEGKQPKAPLAEQDEAWGHMVVPGKDFKTHIIFANAGEDVAFKIISVVKRYRGSCILSGIGTIGSVTLRDPQNESGKIKYEGNYELLKLQGSFTYYENVGIGGALTITMSGQDFRVFGGIVSGTIIASGPVTVVLGCYDTGEPVRFPRTSPPPKFPPSSGDVPAPAAGPPAADPAAGPAAAPVS